MQLTYDDTRFGDNDLLDGAATLRIPLANIVTASLISLGLWSMIGWTAWIVVG